MEQRGRNIMSLSSPHHDAGPSQSSPLRPDLKACLNEIQQQLPPGVTLMIQAPPLAIPTGATGAQPPVAEDLPALLGHLTAGEVRHLAKARTQDVTSAIDRKELRSHEGPHRKHQITVEDALAWVEKTESDGIPEPSHADRRLAVAPGSLLMAVIRSEDRWCVEPMNDQPTSGYWLMLYSL